MLKLTAVTEPTQPRALQEGPASRLHIRVPDLVVPPGGHVQFSWGAGNQLSLASAPLSSAAYERAPGAGPGSASAAPRDGEGAPGGAPWSVHRASWGALGAEGRQLAYDSAEALRALMAQAEGSDREWWQRVLAYSSEIKALLGPPGHAGGEGGAGALSDDEPSWGEANGMDMDSNVEAPSISSPERDLMLAAWELIEILYADRRAHAVLADSLAQWLKNNYAVVVGAEGSAGTRLLELNQLAVHQDPAQDPAYWPTVAALVAVGWTNEAIALLRRFYSASDTFEADNALVEALAVLLQEAPRLWLTASGRRPEHGEFVSMAEYLRESDSYRNKILRLAEGKWAEPCGRDALVGVKSVIGVVLGSQHDVRGATSHWAELMVAQLLHRFPNMRTHSEVASLFEACLEAEEGEDTGQGEGADAWSPVTGLFRAAVNHETEELLRLCSTTFNPWFLAHVTELISARSPSTADLLLRPVDALGGCGVAEFYRIHYTMDLASHPATWQLAVDYLEVCPVFGPRLLDSLLRRQPITSSDRCALLVLDICSTPGDPLHAVAEHTCRAVGIHHWHRGNRGAAIAWLRRVPNEPCLHAIADQLVHQLLTDGGGEETDGGKERTREGGDGEAGPGPSSRPCLRAVDVERLLDNIGTEVTGAGGLGFLQRYRKLRYLLSVLKNKEAGTAEGHVRARMGRNGRQLEARYPGGGGVQVLDLLQEAARVVMTMLRPGGAPHRYWITIFRHSLMLLEWPHQVVFSQQQTHELMSCLQELRTSHRADDWLRAEEAACGGRQQLGALLARLDLALAVNLRRAFLSIPQRG